MQVITKKHKKAASLVMAAIIMMLSSCQTDSIDSVLISDSEERIDMVFEGALDQEIFLTGSAGGSEDLVSIASSDGYAQITLQLLGGQSLILHLHDRNQADPLEGTATGFSVYPNRELEDKDRYVTAELRMAGESSVYQTNHMNDDPGQTFIQVFRVVSNGLDNALFCRLDRLPVFRAQDNTTEAAWITGTFRAVR